MIITVLSRDKISQNLFRTNIQNLTDFVIVGTNSNQSQDTFNERLNFIKSQTKDVIIFHALKRSMFAVSKDWLPEATADYPEILKEVSEVIIYTPTLFQISHGAKLSTLKGDASKLKLQDAL